MREYLNLPADHLHHAHGVGVEGLALVEMLAIGFHAVRRATPQADDRIVVVGLRRIGLGVALAARARGLQVSALDPSPIRRDFALAQRLVHTATDPGSDAVAAAKTIADGHAPDIVIDATGHPSAMEASFGIPGHGGKLVLLGIIQGMLQFSDPDLHRREITVLASRNATAVDFDAVIAALPSIEVAAGLPTKLPPMCSRV
jgi:threonine dehydrogenase-like Zn-dependent dehydrogenase